MTVFLGRAQQSVGDRRVNFSIGIDDYLAKLVNYKRLNRHLLGVYQYPTRMTIYQGISIAP